MSPQTRTHPALVLNITAGCIIYAKEPAGGFSVTAGGPSVGAVSAARSWIPAGVDLADPPSLKRRRRPRLIQPGSRPGRSWPPLLPAGTGPAGRVGCPERAVRADEAVWNGPHLRTPCGWVVPRGWRCPGRRLRGPQNLDQVPSGPRLKRQSQKWSRPTQRVRCGGLGRGPGRRRGRR